MYTNIPSTDFLRLPQILKLFPISKSTWWQGCCKGRYPQPVKLGPRTTYGEPKISRNSFRAWVRGKTMKSERQGNVRAPKSMPVARGTTSPIPEAGHERGYSLSLCRAAPGSRVEC